MSDIEQQTPDRQTYADPDWFLQILVKMANQNGVEMGITLQVGGVLVSGQLVSGKKYFEGFADDFSGAMSDPEEAQGVRNAFAKFGSGYGKEEDESAPQFEPTFIHLKDARVFHPGGTAVPGNRGVWWRGRLSEVAGFVLGSLSAGD